MFRVTVFLAQKSDREDVVRMWKIAWSMDGCPSAKGRARASTSDETVNAHHVTTSHSSHRRSFIVLSLRKTMI